MTAPFLWASTGNVVDLDTMHGQGHRSGDRHYVLPLVREAKGTLWERVAERESMTGEEALVWKLSHPRARRSIEVFCADCARSIGVQFNPGDARAFAEAHAPQCPVRW